MNAFALSHPPDLPFGTRNRTSAPLLSPQFASVGDQLAPFTSSVPSRISSSTKIDPPPLPPPQFHRLPEQPWTDVSISLAFLAVFRPSRRRQPGLSYHYLCPGLDGASARLGPAKKSVAPAGPAEKCGRLVRWPAGAAASPPPHPPSLIARPGGLPLTPAGRWGVRDREPVVGSAGSVRRRLRELRTPPL